MGALAVPHRSDVYFPLLSCPLNANDSGLRVDSIPARASKESASYKCRTPPNGGVRAFGVKR